MTNTFRSLAIPVVLVLVNGFTAHAQDQPAAPKQPLAAPLRVQVVLSKYQGDKKISSLPYMLSVNSDRSRSSLRMGAQVPILTAGAADGKPAAFQYKDVGTSLDCSAYPIDAEGRYKLELTIEDSSVYTDAAAGATRSSDHPSFRSFRSTNTLLLKDGQSAQYTTATDKVSGEVVKVDITLNVVR